MRGNPPAVIWAVALGAVLATACCTFTSWAGAAAHCSPAV
ncbi:hypothetical protein SAMN05216267_1022106 [Actinacidiphila rubida]|uniref:Lipoprotein n=1 Tax=Actinacidiphila rubida TaxID=310780 RepID=A0A1H8NJI4_9ACTN|nr:hypothetical protein SAMN05216267_1022106 [Actinacidiphila rubida]